jgi:hypothetical protein
VWVHFLTLSYTPKSMKCDSWASLLAHTFACPYLGWEPKARVTTLILFILMPKFHNAINVIIISTIYNLVGINYAFYINNKLHYTF